MHHKLNSDLINRTITITVMQNHNRPSGSRCCGPSADNTVCSNKMKTRMARIATVNEMSIINQVPTALRIIQRVESMSGINFKNDFSLPMLLRKPQTTCATASAPCGYRNRSEMETTCRLLIHVLHNKLPSWRDGIMLSWQQLVLLG